MTGSRFLFLIILIFSFPSPAVAQTTFASFEELVRKMEWPKTDFSKTLVDLDEIHHGGPPKDGIPAIDEPVFVPARLIKDIAGTEPVISVKINGIARAYPFRVLMFHEIVNDEIKGTPITVTYCPLCNAAVVFLRNLDGETLDFGVSGWLRNSDLVMYDRQTESWWQQFTGRAIVGDMIGKSLEKVPARIESFQKFKKRHPNGDVLVPNDPGRRSYGNNLYVGFDSLSGPYMPVRSLPENIAPMARVVTVGERAWALSLIRRVGKLETEDSLILSWEQGQNSALDTEDISGGRDIGNILVQRKTPEGLKDVVYGVDFAFAFHAFYPEQPIITEIP